MRRPKDVSSGGGSDARAASTDIERAVSAPASPAPVVRTWPVSVTNLVDSAAAEAVSIKNTFLDDWTHAHDARAQGMRAGSTRRRSQSLPAEGSRRIHGREAPNGPSTGRRAHKDVIGELLHPIVHQRYPTLAGDITGMMLQWSSKELMQLLRNKERTWSLADDAANFISATRSPQTELKDPADGALRQTL